MPNQMHARAKKWIEDSAPSAMEILDAHNKLVSRVRRGIETAEAAEATLDYLGEAFVEGDGDLMQLHTLDPESPETASPSAVIPDFGLDCSALVKYEDSPEQQALCQSEKMLAFAQLRARFGVPNVATR